MVYVTPRFIVFDNQAAKGLWLGASNFYDPIVDKNYDKKVVHAGPRHLDIENETIPCRNNDGWEI